MVFVSPANIRFANIAPSRGDTYFTGGPYGNNTYFLLDRDYVRLKNMEVGYTLRGNALEKAKIQQLRLYVNGLNLLTWDKSGIFDPESENAAGTYYPQSRVINTGINITF